MEHPFKLLGFQDGRSGSSLALAKLAFPPLKLRLPSTPLFPPLSPPLSPKPQTPVPCSFSPSSPFSSPFSTFCLIPPQTTRACLTPSPAFDRLEAMAGPGGWRDKEVTDLGHLPVSKGRPSPPKCSLLRVLSSGVGDGHPQAGLGQDFDGVAGSGRDPGSRFAEKPPTPTPTQAPRPSQIQEKAKGPGGGERRGGSGVVRTLNYGSFSKCGPFCLAVLGYLFLRGSRRGQRARRRVAS